MAAAKEQEQPKGASEINQLNAEINRLKEQQQSIQQELRQADSPKKVELEAQPFNLETELRTKAMMLIESKMQPLQTVPKISTLFNRDV